MVISDYINGFNVNDTVYGVAASLSAIYDSSGVNIANQFDKILNPNVVSLLTETQTMDVDDVLSVDVTDYDCLEIEYTNAINDTYIQQIDMKTITIGKDNEKAFNNVCYFVDAMVVDTLKYYFTEETAVVDDEEITKILFNLYPSNNEGTNIVIKQIYGKNYKI